MCIRDRCGVKVVGSSTWEVNLGPSRLLYIPRSTHGRCLYMPMTTSVQITSTSGGMRPQPNSMSLRGAVTPDRPQRRAGAGAARRPKAASELRSEPGSGLRHRTRHTCLHMRQRVQEGGGGRVRVGWHISLQIQRNQVSAGLCHMPRSNEWAVGEWALRYACRGRVGNARVSSGS